MFDGSLYPLQGNIEETRKIVHLADQYEASVEGEIGVVGGSEGGNENHMIEFTHPQDALTFFQETNLDALAIAIGNAHGNYPVAPKLRFDIIEETSRLVSAPLVLHGGTGLTEDDYKKAIQLGIRKINIATSCYDALTMQAKDYFSENRQTDYFGLNEAMIEGFYNKVKQHIIIFNQ